MLSCYEIHDLFGEILATYPYTVKGLSDAAEHFRGRTLYTALVNPENVDYDNPSGLIREEKDYLEMVWEILA